MDGRVRHYAADELNSGYLNAIKNLASNPMPTVTIFCDDTWLTKSTIDMNGNQLPPGQYQPVG
jgi:hypothetical protein